MARCNKSFFALLAFISKKPRSGYDIKKILERTSHWYWAESNAQIYPMLKKMEKLGCVTSRVDKESGARKRRIYTITKQGKDKLMTWLAQPVEYSTYREELLLKINAGQFVENDQLIAHLEDYLQYLNEQIHTMDEIREHVQLKHKGLPDFAYLMITYDYAIELSNTKKKWCQKTIKKIKQMETVKVNE